MERLRRRQDEETRLPLPPPEIQPEAPLGAAAPIAPATVQVIWGPIADAMAVAGMSAGDVRGLLQRPFRIPGQATTLVNGRPVSPEYRLLAGDVLEFIREAGEKGARG